MCLHQSHTSWPRDAKNYFFQLLETDNISVDYPQSVNPWCKYINSHYWSHLKKFAMVIIIVVIIIWLPIETFFMSVQLFFLLFHSMHVHFFLTDLICFCMRLNAGKIKQHLVLCIWRTRCTPDASWVSSLRHEVNRGQAAAISKCWLDAFLCV